MAFGEQALNNAEASPKAVNFTLPGKRDGCDTLAYAYGVPGLR